MPNDIAARKSNPFVEQARKYASLDLLDVHRKLLRESAISEEVAEARGYRSVSSAKQLVGKFGPVQQRVPGLLIPLFNVYGEQCSFQLRPDEPRIKDGRILKYETPHGLKMMLDCPPSTLPNINDTKVKLWLTEGVRKADSLVTLGLSAIALLGVDSWRGTNEIDGKMVLADWNGVALNDREITIAFDSDSFQKPDVHASTERLKGWLESRGAVLTFLYLPPHDDGSKQGVDDFLAAYGREQLHTLTEPEWHALPHERARQAKAKKSNARLLPTAELLTKIMALYMRFVIFPNEESVLALALFVLHTWAFDAAQATPYIAIDSAVKRCGKTRVEDVSKYLVRSPWKVTSVFEAVLFRKIEGDQPTVLLDEVDAMFGRSTEANEPIRAILNAGNLPGTSVPRMVGDGMNMVPRDFSVYCPKMLAGINTSRWPDTVLDRSIRIELPRKRREEKVEKFRHRIFAAETAFLRDELQRWAQEHVEELRGADPDLPAALDDRAAEAWEPLLAIADLAEREGGEDCGKRARKAALKLAEVRVEDDSHGVLALGAIRSMFGNREALHTTTITERLNHDEQLPFNDYRRNAGINDRSLAKLLKPFGIIPHPVRIEGSQARGYRRDQFLDAWSRYLPTPRSGDSEASQRHEASSGGRFDHFRKRHTPPSCDGSKTAETPDEH